MTFAVAEPHRQALLQQMLCDQIEVAIMIDIDKENPTRSRSDDDRHSGGKHRSLCEPVSDPANEQRQSGCQLIHNHLTPAKACEKKIALPRLSPRKPDRL